MSERALSLLLEDTSSSINYIMEFTKGMHLDEYQADVKTRYAVERNFEIIGEAASRVPQAFKLQHLQVEWRIIKDFRNFIIHDYFGINQNIVWDTIQYRLPDLLEQITVLKNQP
ncbi:hypothetical protein A9P82_13575 [Arachidicoccus ginsenosidimutans]|uniref:HepT-like ribonuclease domain-containing protein n=1 Tax=Arachidicoccus sp. BS20 TaxID=1850526 RepID=UPI0007F0A0A7|nr:DUF86 domain-containing protein [Arachidicoccus sp. BS20]ANI90228.1 hypothetical protein A9P82_13575 [Arachidicoccus sp. BS20]